MNKKIQLSFILLLNLLASSLNAQTPPNASSTLTNPTEMTTNTSPNPVITHSSNNPPNVSSNQVVSSQTLQNYISTINFKSWLDYAKNLSLCTPGQFNLLNAETYAYMQNIMKSGNPVSLNELNAFKQILFMQASIKGWSNNSCQVIFTMQQPFGTAMQTVIEECLFPKEKITELTTAANQMGNGSIQMLENGKPSPGMLKFGESLMQYCKPQQRT